MFPWRLCISGGWLDQPWVSKVMRGGVIVMNVGHHPEFKNAAGLATSSRNVALKLWSNGKIPGHLNNEEVAKLVFGAENPPGTKYGMFIMMEIHDDSQCVVLCNFVAEFTEFIDLLFCYFAAF